MCFKWMTGILMIWMLMGCEKSNPVSSQRNGVDTLSVSNGGDAVFSANDPATIVEAEIDGDVLILKVVFSGGCEPHDFRLEFDGNFMESYPVQANLFLYHDAHGDACEAEITEELQFDLTPLKDLYMSYYRDEGPVILRIHEPGQRGTFKVLIVYEFP